MSDDVFFTFKKKVDPWNPNSASQNVDVPIAIVGAHESVISQWLFFRTLFDSDFVDGCTGTKKIIDQGLKPKTFHLMIKFMYVGILRREITTLYEDETENASWEELYIAADRYRIYDLRMLALATIEKNNIAKKYHAEIAKKQFKDAHRGHPEFVALVCESKDKTENLSFCIRCDATVSSTQSFEVQSDRGNFKLIVTDSDGNYLFCINTASSDFTLFQKYKRCSFKQPQGNTWNQYNLGCLFFGKYYIAAEISRAQLQTIDQQHELEFCLISKGGTSVSSPAVSEPVYTDVLMKRYYRDKESPDVFFKCNDEPLDDHANSLSNGKGLSDTIYGKDVADPVEGATIGAHRFILSQWPYFKSMFESGFKEGGSGAKKPIRIKGVKPKSFQMIIQFIYMGTLPPTAATLIDDLRKLALTTIEAKLDSAAAVEFLFRSAYLYTELRELVVRYIAKEHHAEISKREVREAHKAHAEFSELQGELYDALHEQVASKGCACRVNASPRR
ncbi:hypothetical protein BG003_010987 [Podila horticola]|nr:hypothetical protein BG003_010987 [Podila horticola]